MKKRKLVTAALLYANGPVHIGHLAGCYLPADAYARYCRLKGYDVLFVTGSDEHGVPITIKAQKEGVRPQQVVDKYHEQIKKTFLDFGISPDIYSRTSNPIHHATSQEFFKNLYEAGKFVEETSLQYYDAKAHTFLADRYIVGTCPRCGNDKAYGDQCERCGSTLSPSELISPTSALSGEVPVLKETKNWYLPLDAIQTSFLDAYIDQHAHWKPNVLGQCKSWLQEGLKPRAMTRDLDWGVPLPIDNTQGKVLYVWFDAPIGYLSMSKEFFERFSDEEYKNRYNVWMRKESAALASSFTWQDFWSDTSPSELIHFIGKDNIVFHCLIFPAMCHELGGLKLADEVPANEFLNLEGEKISTSRNWAVWAHEYLQDFPGKQDAMRYFLLANAPENKDNNFTWKDFQTANNSELVGILGNFVNRSLVLTQKYYQGVVPTPAADASYHNVYAAIQERVSAVDQLLSKFQFREALYQLIDLARLGNKFLADKEPWKTAQSDPRQTADVLYVSLQICAKIALLMEPFMPYSAAKLQDMLQWSAPDWDILHQSVLLPEGHELGSIGLLFEKIEDQDIQKQLDKLNSTKTMTATINTMENAKEILQKPNISFDEFSKMDLRVVEIVEAEKVEKTDKLMRLTVSLGAEKRTVVSGIAQHYSAQSLVGKKVLYLANLVPRKIKGIESTGMILMAEDREGKLYTMNPDNSQVESGAEVR